MDLEDALAGRRSIRSYRPDPVAEQVLEHLIQSAVLAPNAVNQQPWTFTVVRDRRRLDALSEESKRHMLGSLPAGIHAENFRARLQDPAFHIFYHAPVLIIISGAEAGPWVVEDCALAAENLMLAAHGAGLGSCWIGFAQGYLGTPAGKARVGMPPDWVPVAPIVIGHPDGSPPPAPRRPATILWG